MLLTLLVTLFLDSGSQALYAQRSPYSAAQIQQNLNKLNTLGSVLHIAAHPDDENTQLLAYFANHRHLRTGYLSLTRGEGGQNLIGTEQGDFMGLIRTQELLAARRIDGAEQFFTRAIDFGFSKTADETLQKWGREQVLADVVWTIRRFRPDVIFTRFSGTPRDGHGHHQSSAILAKEAFEAAADPNRFPEQLKSVKPWQAKRIMFNLFSFNREMEAEAAKTPGRLEIDAGQYNPILGLSYGEIAGLSRSQHQSQGMGSPERRGSVPNYLVAVAGTPASKGVLEGIDTSWNRVPKGDQIATILGEAVREFRPGEPARTIPLLSKARPLIAAIDHPDAAGKLAELDELVLHCAGIWLDASANRFAVHPGAKTRVTLSVVNRASNSARLIAAGLNGLVTAKADPAATTLALNKPVEVPVEVTIPADAPYSQPYWLEQPKRGTLYAVADPKQIGAPESAPALTAHFNLAVDGNEFTITRRVLHRYVDPVRGELTRALVVVPPVALEFSTPSIIFPDTRAKAVQVSVKAIAPKASGVVRLETKPGWKIEPDSQPFQLGANEQTNVIFRITPPAGDSTVSVIAVAEMDGKRYAQAQRVIDYPHIPPQTVFPPATAQLVHADIKLTSKNIGYIMGAGDEVPEALKQLGAQIAMLSDDDLASTDLARFDAVVTGVRAFNTRPALRANFQRLLDFTANGGTLVVQYNVLEGFGRSTNDILSKIGPYPLTVSRDRVTDEDSPVNLTSHPVLAVPNQITKKDFEGWVQERGLYFAKEFDPKYTSLLSTKDPGDDWLPGGMLYAKYGKGAYVFTGYSWFRQLPAGVPGAYRIFANLLSAK
jgi:LmbE family N-acetylglucosaminyl deacetylase